MCYSCASANNIEVSSYEEFIENVPFYHQEAYQCGPAALAGVLNYWGVEVTPNEVAREVFSKSARGTLNIDMVLYAKRKGLKATAYSGNIEDVKRNISNGLPTIVLVDFGLMIYQANHYMVVIGYNEHNVVVNSGKHQREILSWEDFKKAWEKTHFWTLLIVPQ